MNNDQIEEQEEHECPEYGKALVLYLLSELQRIHWNIYQKQLNEFVPFWHCGDIRYRRYNEENPEPNLSYRSTAIRWYKHPGRGMTVNKNMDTQQWVNWFEMCLEHMHSIEKAHYIKQGILTHGTIKGIKPTSPE